MRTMDAPSEDRSALDASKTQRIPGVGFSARIGPEPDVELALV